MGHVAINYYLLNIREGTTPRWAKKDKTWQNLVNLVKTWQSIANNLTGQTSEKTGQRPPSPVNMLKEVIGIVLERRIKFFELSLSLRNQIVLGFATFCVL